MIRNSVGASVAVMALLGEISAVDLKKGNFYNLVSTSKNIDYSDGDEFMADSIKEAEQELAGHKDGQDSFRDQVNKAVSEDHEANEQEPEGSSKGKATKKMEEDMISSALTTQTKVTFTGNEVDVAQIGVDGTEQIKQQNKAAIKEALKEVAPEMVKEAPKNATKSLN